MSSHMSFHYIPMSNSHWIMKSRCIYIYVQYIYISLDICVYIYIHTYPWYSICVLYPSDDASIAGSFPSDRCDFEARDDFQATSSQGSLSPSSLISGFAFWLGIICIYICIAQYYIYASYMDMCAHFVIIHIYIWYVTRSQFWDPPSNELDLIIQGLR